MNWCDYQAFLTWPGPQLMSSHKSQVARTKCTWVASVAISTLLLFQTFDVSFADEKVHNPVLMSCRRLCEMSCQMLLHRPGQEAEQVTRVQPTGSYMACHVAI